MSWEIARNMLEVRISHNLVFLNDSGDDFISRHDEALLHAHIENKINLIPEIMIGDSDRSTKIDIVDALLITQYDVGFIEQFC
jgi:hypothetical protein